MLCVVLAAERIISRRDRGESRTQGSPPQHQDGIVMINEHAKEEDPEATGISLQYLAAAHNPQKKPSALCMYGDVSNCRA